jgi:hypothetical protein
MSSLKYGSGVSIGQKYQRVMATGLAGSLNTGVLLRCHSIMHGKTTGNHNEPQ